MNKVEKITQYHLGAQEEASKVVRTENAEVFVDKIIIQHSLVDDTKREIVVLRIINAFGEEKMLKLPFEVIQSKELFLELEKENVVFSVSSKEKQQFRNNILLQRASAKRVIEYVGTPGFFYRNEEWFCKLGQNVYSKEGVYNKFSRDISAPELRDSPKDSYLKALRYVEVDDSVAPMVLLEIALAVWDKILADSGCLQRHTLYVVGETGTMKSSIVREATKIFNEKAEMTLSSTYSAIQASFERYKLLPVLLDDYNESEFAKVKRSKGEKVVEIIQLHADRETLSKMQARKMVQIKLESSLIVTAEKPLENPSSMNRCLVVTPTNVNKEILTEVQTENRENAIFSDLIRELVLYTLHNYARLQDAIPRIHSYIKEEGKRFEQYQNVPGYHRVIDSYRVAFVGAIMLYEFLISCLSESEADRISKKIHEALEDSVSRTFSLLDKKDPKLELLSALYNVIRSADAKGRIASTKKEFENGKYIGMWDEKQKLYISGDVMKDLLSMELNEVVSKKKISAALYNYGLVALYNGRHSKSIAGMKGNERYYCINYKKLRKLFATPAKNILDLIGAQ